jgi:Zn-dependent alcohol dehydrogenase
VAGHEAAGVVEEVGDNVTITKPGDRVVVSLLRACGRCFHCATGFPHMCKGKFALDTESRLRNKRGEPIRHGNRTAAFAEYVIVEQSQVVPLSDEIPLDRAALLACGVITGVGAVLNTAQVELGRSVVVIGVGGVGINAIQGAVLAGAYPIIAVDLLENKLAAAKAFGATDTINVTKQKTPERVVRKLTAGSGADYVFVTVGSADAVALGFKMIGLKGTEVIVGIPQSGAQVSFPISRFVSGERRVMGSAMGSSRLSVDVPQLIELYQRGRLKLDELITARYPLEQINNAIEMMEQGGVLRNVIIF